MGSDLDGDKYCLRWNDFTSNISSAFKELRDDEDFFDITLLTEEGEIRAHKLILGACSPHFRYVFLNFAFFIETTENRFRLARQTCPADLPGRLARQTCPADLPGRLARQTCPADLPVRLAWLSCYDSLDGLKVFSLCSLALLNSFWKLTINFFFRQIIKRLPNIQNPAIYLRGVRHEDIKNILEFMYLGEVSIVFMYWKLSIIYDNLIFQLNCHSNAWGTRPASLKVAKIDRKWNFSIFLKNLIFYCNQGSMWAPTLC
jgi:hypothetical protein